MGDETEQGLREIRTELRQVQRQLSRLTLLVKANTKSLLSLEEASLYTGYARSYLYKLTGSGELPCLRPTKRRVFIEREEIDKFMRKNKQEL